MKKPGKQRAHESRKKMSNAKSKKKGMANIAVEKEWLNGDDVWKSFITTTNSFECDVSKSKVLKGTEMYRCEKLNMNVLPKCYEEKIKKKEFLLYNNPVCPYANRASIAASEKNLSYDVQMIALTKEINFAKDNFDDWKSGSEYWSTTNITFEELEQKNKDFRENINPAGLIPTVVHNERKIFESGLIVRYLDETWPNNGVQLTPSNAYERYRIRITLSKFNTGALIAALMNQDPTKDEECRTKIYSFFETFVKHADKDGPFFLGEKFSIVEVMMFPFYDRFRYLLPGFRDFEYIPTDDESYPWAARMKKWSDAVNERESCKQVSLGKDKYLVIYDQMGFAGARGKSKFGQ
jgi:glutathione S-transferase